MSSLNHSTSDIEDAFSSMNILNYTLVSPDYFPASAGSSSFNSLENAKNNIIPPVFSSFYNNPYKMYLKHHEKQVEDILNYLDELSPHRIEKMEERPINDEKGEGKYQPLEKSLKSKPPKKVVIHDYYPDQTIIIGGNLSTECRSGLIEILRKHADAFTWTPTDMTEIPRFITEHELKTYPHVEPRVQRKQSIALDRRKVVKDEVAEWLKARIVRKVWYPTWVANPVLVKKPDNSWRMCIDFKELNKACPKDLYPLPEINWKIEFLMGFKYKLKNAGATYQRLVDTIFEGQIGRNLEAYVDDMVIKSKTEPEMIKDVEEMLLTLKKVNMKLNPKKCSFEMEEGKFLGYIVTSEGIRANPEKIKAIVNMPSPSNLKQMQRLSGKLAALNRFLSKVAKRALPCLDTLKGVQTRRISIRRRRLKKHSRK
ncbi:reverse transcriptase domain-containing protein [Tanacetum coccineum]